MISYRGVQLSILLLGVMSVSAMAGASEGEHVTGTESRASGARLEIEGIAAATGEDDPRILFILPWQPPALPRRPRAELENRAPELEQPLKALTLENHRRFRETLDPTVLDPHGIRH